MKKEMESFRNYKILNEREYMISLYKVTARLTIIKAANRNKEAILSDLRALEGVTVVSVKKQNETEHHDFSTLMVKIDTTPLSNKQVIPNMLRIRREAMKIKGVSTFRFMSRPEKIKK